MVWNLALWVLLRPRRWFGIDDFPATGAVVRDWKAVRDEALELRRGGVAVPAFDQLDPGQRRLTADGGWRSFVLRFGGNDVPANRALCPTTTALLDEVPDVYTAMFSVLEPGTRLPLHAGAIKGVVRFLLPVVVPDDGACRLHLGGVTRVLAEGEPLYFDDTYPHRAANEAGGERVTLFVDLVRPMPWPWLDRANRRFLRRLGASRRMLGAVVRAEAATARP